MPHLRGSRSDGAHIPELRQDERGVPDRLERLRHLLRQAFLIKTDDGLDDVKRLLNRPARATGV